MKTIEEAKDGLNKFYKANELNRAGKDFRDAVNKSFERHSNNPAFIDKWIEEASESYMEADYDGERFQKIVWDMENKPLLDLLEKNGVDLNDMGCGNFTRNELNKLMKKEERALLKDLKEAFEEDLKDKREGWASERASDDFDIFWGECKTDEDYYAMGFDTSIEGYENKAGECIAEKDIIGVCHNCNELFTKEHLPKILPTEKRDDEYNEVVFCEECGHSVPFDNLTPELKKEMGAEIAAELL
jgi:hypothetical protein